MSTFVKPINAEFIVPSEASTKRLKMKRTQGKRKVVISSNWLPLYNFNAGDSMVTRPLDSGNGMIIELVTDLFSLNEKKPKKVYKRTYPKRKNNPIEVMIDIGSQKEIDQCFDADVEDLHVKFEFNRLTVTAIKKFKGKVMRNALRAEPYSVFAACSSGVDLHLMESEHGCTITGLIEWRPNELRDKKDLSETGALVALRNVKKGIKYLFNEDIAEVSREQLTQAAEKHPSMIFMASPQCDEFTNVKANSLKQSHLNDLSSSLDMTLDIAKIVDCQHPPIIKLEQVVGWYKSDIYKMLSLRLRKLGYQENLLISSGEKRGGYTNRTRGYAVFTMLDAPFEFEADIGSRSEPIWPIIEKYLPECRDVTHSKSLQDGKRIGRLRTITPESKKCPSILKSQDRMAKDSCCIELNNRLYWPSENLVKELMSINGIQLDCVSQSIGSEIIGQSVDGALHNSVARSVINHINAFIENNKKSDTGS